MNQRSTEKGSALVMILIGVVLFAALSYAVANMMRGGSVENISSEKVKLFANEIMEFSTVLRQGVQDLRISNGCSENDLSFEATGLTGYGHTPPARDECKLFNPSGGGKSYVKPQAEWLDDNKAAQPTYGNYAFVRQFSMDSIGTEESDLAIVLNYVRKDICIAINDHLGIINPSDAPPKAVESFHSTELFVGNYTATNDVQDALQTKGKPAGCVQTANDSHYVFYQVLLAR